MNKVVSYFDCRAVATMAGALVQLFNLYKPEELPSDYLEQLRLAFYKGGVEGFKKAVIDENNAWKTIKMDLAIIGAAGAGKSALTNALCGCTSKDDNIAAVDYIDGSKTVQCFPFPHNPNITLCDIPGVGTSDFPRETYLRVIDIDKHDCCLIIVNTRFTMDDAWLAEVIKNGKKSFCYVYTKIDQAVKSEKNEKRRKLSKAEVTEVVDKVRRIVSEQIQNHNIAADLFLVNSYKPLQFDFEKLIQAILNHLPEKLRQALLLSLPCSGPFMVKAKSKELKKRASKMAFRPVLSPAYQFLAYPLPLT